MEMQIGATRAVIAAIPLKECIKIPGIKDGTLFRKNVHQSLGTGNYEQHFTDGYFITKRGENAAPVKYNSSNCRFDITRKAANCVAFSEANHLL